MPKRNLTTVSSLGAVSCVVLPLLIGCTGVMSGDPNSNGQMTPGGLVPGATGGGGGTSSTGGAGPTGAGTAGTGPISQSSKPEVDVMTIRRLNRTQYTNTLRSLLGTKQDPGSKFPPDDLSFGFDNIGEALSLQPLHIELFESSADAVLTELFALPASDPNRSKVLSCDAQTGGHACVVSTVSAFAEKAFRRPVTDAEIAPFVTLAESHGTTGTGASDGLKLALKGVLLSPHFLFKVELDASPTAKDVHKLTAYELATRLSYYLWSNMPDAALSASAKSGELLTDAGLTSQITRMLADPQAQALVTEFAAQWLNIRRVAAVKPDPTTYPTFSADLATAMQTETSMLFSELLGQGRPLTELLTANYSFVNSTLATFYGMAPPAGSGFTKVQLAGSHRTGFLTGGSFLTMTSNPTRTSPVKRGKWVLEQLLCSPPPPPPAGANIAALDGGTPQSMRAKLEQHRAKEPCHTCHSLMDPIGLAFENFDGVGAYRTSDQYGAIDATGTLNTANGPVNFNGADQLIPIVSNDPRMAPCAASKVLTYAVGRGFTVDDAIALQNVLAATDKSGQGVRGLIGSVALSESFRSRRAVGE
ncbi:MAG TPA: DUF1592 domain-containing protein [Polyangiaceae bacterium]|nr:DUF1592 domain-containing protein [Polyangiaceae bacterium]